VGYVLTNRGMGRLRGRRRLGQYDSAYSGYSNADPSLNTPGPSSSIFDLPGGVNYQNLATGTLTPSQVATLQAQGAAQVSSVYDNAVTYYGEDSPAAQAAAAVLPTQIAGVYSDIAALNPQPSSTDPLLSLTGIAWYWWALGAVGIFVVVEHRK
jgi:hypothetical protein